MTDSFPLLKTPPSALKLVMQNLEIIDIVSLSLTSIKTRMALVPVNHPICYLYVHISRGVFDFKIYSVQGELKVACKAEGFGTPGFSYTSLRTGQELVFPETDLRLWFLEILRILNHPGIDCFSFYNGTDKLANIAVDLLKGIKIGALYSQNLLVARKLIKNCDCLEWGFSRNLSQEFFVQNMNSFHDLYSFYTKISIDDLLASNIHCINLDQMYFSLKEYNRFLKCWIRGGTSNLEILEVQRYENFEERYGITIDETNFEERLFKGIPYKKFKTSGPYHFVDAERNVTLTDGF